jgi:hypothetical protein
MAWSSLPAPMLARSGRLPARSGYAFEVKWDGFRAIVRTEGDFRVRSRRGWNMTERVPELVELPAAGIFDGNLSPSAVTACRVSRPCVSGSYMETRQSR